MLNKDTWDKYGADLGPFVSYEFLNALESSGCTGKNSGWVMHNFVSADESACLFSYEKTHSYGEFIFDWTWAEAYERYGLSYYPKLTSMSPFSPVTTPHFLMQTFNEEKANRLLLQTEELYGNNPYSGNHFLFLTSQEKLFFERTDYIIRESIQYHFINEGYESFDNFLDKLKGKKAKALRKERNFPELTFRRTTGDDLNDDQAQRMYGYYISTIADKNSFDYLNEQFFRTIFRTMKERILFVEAFENENPIAGSLFFYDKNKLYGRYWGARKFVNFLHFELCYYQGIDFCLEKKLSLFEAGAQGEHKILRGFRPVRMHSAHKLKHPAFHKAIHDFIQKEKQGISLMIQELSEALPFRK